MNSLLNSLNHLRFRHFIDEEIPKNDLNATSNKDIINEKS